VDIVFADADMEPDLIDASVKAGAKGIVIAGVGNGNMNKVSVDAAASAVKKGVVVVRSSRVATGMVDRNVEVNDDLLGFIASDELNPQKSRNFAFAGTAQQAAASSNTRALQNLLSPRVPQMCRTPFQESSATAAGNNRFEWDRHRKRLMTVLRIRSMLRYFRTPGEDACQRA
jgi:hypothetical protein